MVPVAIILIIQGLGVAFLDPMHYNDSREYLAIAESIVAGKGYSIAGSPLEGFDSFVGEAPTRMRQPLYPLYLALFYWLPGGSARCVQIAQIVLNLSTFYLMFLIARRTFRQNLWIGTMVALALYFPVWLASVFLLTETLFIFLLVCSMFFLQKALEEQRNWCFTVAGALLGAAALTRPVGIVFILLGFFLIWAYSGIRKAPAKWAILAASAVIVLFPWFLRNAVVLGDYTPLSSDGGFGLWVSTLKRGEPDWHDSPKFRSAVQDDYFHGRAANQRFVNLAVAKIKRDPLRHFVTGLKRIAWAWSYFPGSLTNRISDPLLILTKVVQYVLLVLAILGIFSGLNSKESAYYLFPAVALSFVMFFHWGTSRYVVPAMPFVMILAGQGFWSVCLRRIMRKTGEFGAIIGGRS